MGDNAGILCQWKTLFIFLCYVHTGWFPFLCAMCASYNSIVNEWTQNINNLQSCGFSVISTTFLDLVSHLVFHLTLFISQSLSPYEFVQAQAEVRGCNVIAWKREPPNKNEDSDLILCMCRIKMASCPSGITSCIYLSIHVHTLWVALSYKVYNLLICF